MTYSDFWPVALIGFIASLIIFKIGIRFGARLGLIDQPGGRKMHEGAIPLIGGLIIVPVFAALVYVTNLHDVLPLSPLLFGVLLLLIIGAIDDKFNIHPWARFIIQIWLACFIVIFAQGQIENLGNLFGLGNVQLGWFGTVFSVTCLVLLMNAINMMDGMDGLAGGFMAVALGWLMIAAYNAGQMSSVYAMALLLIPIAAFLAFNTRHPLRAKASVFLGDAGSLSLSLILGWFAIRMAQEIPNGGEVSQAIPAVVIIWIMTVPIMDTFAIFFVRMKQGRSPFEADRLHLHHKFQDYGLDIKWATPLILLLAAVTGGIGYMGIEVGIPEYVLLYTWSGILAGYTAYRLKYANENNPLK